MVTGPLIYLVAVLAKLNYPELPTSFLLPGYFGFISFAILFFVLLLFFRKYNLKSRNQPRERHRKLFGMNTTSYYSLESNREGAEEGMTNKS